LDEILRLMIEFQRTADAQVVERQGN